MNHEDTKTRRKKLSYLFLFVPSWFLCFYESAIARVRSVERPAKAGRRRVARARLRGEVEWIVHLQGCPSPRPSPRGGGEGVDLVASSLASAGPHAARVSGG